MSYKDLHNMLQTTKLRQHILQLKDKEESIAVMFNNGQFTSFMLVIHFWLSVYVLHYQSTACTLLINPDTGLSRRGQQSLPPYANQQALI